MLVISRKPGESLILGDDIKITLLSGGSDKVTLGIEAPKSVNIVREELLEIIKVNKESVNQGKEKNLSKVAALMKLKNSEEKP